MRKRISVLIEPWQEGGSDASRMYDYVQLAAIIMGVVPLMFRKHEMWMAVFDVASCVVFIIDYMLRWYTADCRSKTSGIWPFLIYPFTPTAIMDLMSILPTFTLVNASFKLFRMGRFLRIIRLLRVFRYYKPLQVMLAVLRKEKTTLLTVMAFAAIYIFITALIMFNAEDVVNPDSGEPVFESFFDAVYWAACTLTTVGYGDICPVSWVGRMVSMVSAIMGVAIIALPSGIITAAYLQELKGWEGNKKQEK